MQVLISAKNIPVTGQLYRGLPQLVDDFADLHPVVFRSKDREVSPCPTPMKMLAFRDMVEVNHFCLARCTCASHQFHMSQFPMRCMSHRSLGNVALSDTATHTTEKARGIVYARRFRVKKSKMYQIYWWTGPCLYRQGTVHQHFWYINSTNL